jgi:hypothetical protein
MINIVARIAPGEKTFNLLVIAGPKLKIVVIPMNNIVIRITHFALFKIKI